MPSQASHVITPSLSDVLLNDLRVETANSALLELGGGAAVEIASHQGPVVHVVLDGAIELYPRNDGAVLRMSAGDSVLAFYGDPHRLGARDAIAVRHLFETSSAAASEAPALIQAGDNPRSARLFSSAIRLAYVSPTAFAYRAAPDFWALSAGGAVDDPAERGILIDADLVARACTGQGGSAFATTFASLHYVHLLRLMSLRLLRDRPLDIRAPNTRRMMHVVRAIKTHPDRMWTVAVLASEVGLSRSAFAEAFVACEGVAPLTFVTRVRMDRAAQLLRTGVLSLHEVSRRVGYQNEGSFARAFKRHWGISPGEYARKHMA